MSTIEKESAATGQARFSDRRSFSINLMLSSLVAEPQFKIEPILATEIQTPFGYNARRFGVVEGDHFIFALNPSLR